MADGLGRAVPTWGKAHKPKKTRHLTEASLDKNIPHKQIPTTTHPPFHAVVMMVDMKKTFHYTFTAANFVNYFELQEISRNQNEYLTTPTTRWLMIRWDPLEASPCESRALMSP